MCRPVHPSRVRTVTSTREPHGSRPAGQFVTAAPILYPLLQRWVTEDVPCGRTLCPAVTSCWPELLFMGVMLCDEPPHCGVIWKLDRSSVESVGIFELPSCVVCSLFKHQSPSYPRGLFIPRVVLGMLNHSLYRL